MYEYQIERLRAVALDATNYGSLPHQPEPTQTLETALRSGTQPQNEAIA